MEIVTEPDIRTAEQARRYAEELQLLLRAIGASDADMERGQMRVEANVSLRPRGTEPFGTRVEVKNMNSFRSVERAIAFEIERQARPLDAGEPLVQETRGWDEERGETYRMRSKETSDDYRYFPEPDLPPLHLDPAWLGGIRARLPELPARPARALPRRISGCRAYDAAVLVADPDGVDRSSRRPSRRTRRCEPKAVANWVTGEYAAPPRTRQRPRSPSSAGRARRHHRRGRATARCRGRSGREVLAEHARTGASASRHHRGARASARSRTGRARRRRGCGPRGQSGGRRRLPRGQGAGGRVPRRPGDEGDRAARRTRRSSRAAVRRTSRRRALTEDRGGTPQYRPVGRGVALIAIGYSRGRGPYARYQALKAQDANVARYEAWRGGIRDDSTTGASVAMEILRRQAQIGAGIAIAGSCWCSSGSSPLTRRSASAAAASELEPPLHVMHGCSWPDVRLRVIPGPRNQRPAASGPAPAAIRSPCSGP